MKISQPSLVTPTECSNCAESFAVASHSGPAIAQNRRILTPDIEHRLDREEHAFLQLRPGARAGAVHDIRLVVEKLAEAMTAKILNHGKPVLASYFRDRRANVAEPVTRVSPRQCRP